MPSLLTTKQAADHLGVKMQTIRSWIKNKSITYYKIGGRYKIEQSVVEAMLAAHTANDANILA